jgi:hypothetical protein
MALNKRFASFALDRWDSSPALTAVTTRGRLAPKFDTGQTSYRSDNVECGLTAAHAAALAEQTKDSSALGGGHGVTPVRGPRRRDGPFVFMKQALLAHLMGGSSAPPSRQPSRRCIGRHAAANAQSSRTMDEALCKAPEPAVVSSLGQSDRNQQEEGGHRAGAEVEKVQLGGDKLGNPRGGIDSCRQCRAGNGCRQQG